MSEKPEPETPKPAKPKDPLVDKLAGLMLGNLAANNANPEAKDLDEFERSKGAREPKQ